MSSEIPAISRLHQCERDVSEHISSQLSREERSTGSGPRACSLSHPHGGTGMGMRSRAGGQHWKWIVVPLLAGCGAMVGQDRIPSAPGHVCPLCWAGKPSQALIPLETALPWPCPSHEAPAGRVLLQQVQQRCSMPSASPSPVAPSASALRTGGTGCPDPGEGLPILGITILGSPAVAPSRWRQPFLLSLWDAVQLHLRILYSCLLAHGVLLFFLDLLG